MMTFHRSEPFVLEANYSEQNVNCSKNIIGRFLVDKVTPQATGEASKVKVKLRLDVHGIFNVSSAIMVERLESAEQADKDEAMEVESNSADVSVNPAGTPNDTPPQSIPDSSKESMKDSNQEDMQVDPGQKESQEHSKPEEVVAEKKDNKKKLKVRNVDLPIEAEAIGLSQQVINQLAEKEGQMMMQDKLEKDRADAKNAVEEYLYDMRSKISSILEPFVSVKHREDFENKLSATENWLYEEGEDETKSVYESRLTDLKNLGQPIVKRYQEFTWRPGAFEELGQSLQLIQKALDSYNQKDENYSHLEHSDIDKVTKCVAEKREWFDKKLNEQNQRPCTAEPVVLVSQIRQEKQSLESTCGPILSKPKPKAKEDPPKEIPKQDTQASNNCKNTNNSNEPSATEPKAATGAEHTKAAMELD